MRAVGVEGARRARNRRLDVVQVTTDKGDDEEERSCDDDDDDVDDEFESEIDRVDGASARRVVHRVGGVVAVLRRRASFATARLG